MRVALSVFGYVLVAFELEPAAPSAAPPVPPVEPAAAAKQPTGETPGPVTERIAPPVTSIGFTKRVRHADGRDRWC